MAVTVTDFAKALLRGYIVLIIGLVLVLVPVVGLVAALLVAPFLAGHEGARRLPESWATFYGLIAGVIWATVLVGGLVGLLDILSASNIQLGSLELGMLAMVAGLQVVLFWWGARSAYIIASLRPGDGTRSGEGDELDLDIDPELRRRHGEIVEWGATPEPPGILPSPKVGGKVLDGTTRKPTPAPSTSPSSASPSPSPSPASPSSSSSSSSAPAPTSPASPSPPTPVADPNGPSPAPAQTASMGTTWVRIPGDPTIPVALLWKGDTPAWPASGQGPQPGNLPVPTPGRTASTRPSIVTSSSKPPGSQGSPERRSLPGGPGPLFRPKGASFDKARPHQIHREGAQPAGRTTPGPGSGSSHSPHPHSPSSVPAPGQGRSPIPTPPPSYPPRRVETPRPSALEELQMLKSRRKKMNEGLERPATTPRDTTPARAPLAPPVRSSSVAPSRSSTGLSFDEGPRPRAGYDDLDIIQRPGKPISSRRTPGIPITPSTPSTPSAPIAPVTPGTPSQTTEKVGDPKLTPASVTQKPTSPALKTSSPQPEPAASSDPSPEKENLGVVDILGAVARGAITGFSQAASEVGTRTQGALESETKAVPKTKPPEPPASSAQAVSSSSDAISAAVAEVTAETKKKTKTKTKV